MRVRDTLPAQILAVWHGLAHLGPRLMTHRWWRLVPVLVVPMLVACAHIPQQSEAVKRAGLQASTAELRTRAVELGRELMREVELAADSIASRSTDPAIRRNCSLETIDALCGNRGRAQAGPRGRHARPLCLPGPAHGFPELGPGILELRTRRFDRAAHPGPDCRDVGRGGDLDGSPLQRRRSRQARIMGSRQSDRSSALHTGLPSRRPGPEAAE